MSFVDLTGMKFGRLTVLERAENYITPSNGKKRSQWLCECECGNKCVVQSGHLKSGHTQSCGCYNRDIVKEKGRTHGESKTSLYFVWKSMRQRCKNPNNSRYWDYGGRGIDVCAEWDDFLNFKEWAYENGYAEGLTIDRIDNDKGYSPENCRVTDYIVQGNNKRNVRQVEYNGKKQTIREIADRVGIDRDLLSQRVFIHGWDIDKAIREPTKKPIELSYNGSTRTITEWADITGINYDCLWSRYHSGWSAHDILTTPKKERYASE